IFTLLLISSALTVFAAKPAMVKYTVQAKNITSIETRQAINVEYTQGNETSVIVTTPERLRNNIDIKIKDGELTACFNGKVNMKLGESVTITVTAPAVNEFEASSAGSIKIKGLLSLSGKNVEIEASSAASITAESIVCGNIDIESSSASSVSIASCKANTVEASASSASSLTINGINATKVKGNSSSAASLKLSGSCTKAQLSKSSMGSLSSSGLKTKE
ncbi:MAG: DUF2807 domain-containing protein, partial [Paramuribaculum sp.]|nr:DUF2807 domain-containing protein [Paramuribaculum sp.]